LKNGVGWTKKLSKKCIQKRRPEFHFELSVSAHYDELLNKITFCKQMYFEFLNKCIFLDFVWLSLRIRANRRSCPNSSKIKFVQIKTNHLNNINYCYIVSLIAYFQKLIVRSNPKTDRILNETKLDKTNILHRPLLL
jgi:hypothetical protein